ncbi:polyribonucleotide nucleotidyltransferase [Euzebya tangerina]|uniref:polyribonucleotide nucleotidyltransferase n=1 Tax=Euzebya tangerina TaxID=591198 RepID=UPI000E31BFD7|nr:polyribonucleotide nucleotidyltransferase [Euzebya tangerina]
MTKLGTFEASAKIGGVDITMESGKLAGQAGGSVVCHLGETILLVTSTASGRPKDHLDFFPLTVDFEEKMYAAGRIPGSFFKREGRPSENAILTCRLVDRPLRPTFADGLRNEVQVLITTLSADQSNPPDVLAINGASAATVLAGIPFDGPVAGVRMGMDIKGNWTVFPTFEWMESEGVFDLVVAGRLNPTSGEVDILMVEAEATENAVTKIEMGAVKPTEEVLGAALEEAKGYLKQLCDLQNELADKAGDRAVREYPTFAPYDSRVYDAVEKSAAKDMGKVLVDDRLDKAGRSDAMSEIRDAAIDYVFANAGDVDVSDEELEKQSKNAFRSLEKSLIRRRVVNDNVRIDGRGPRDIRALSAEVGVLPRAHGSGIFTRGETQVLNVLTLGMLRDAQRLDTIDPSTEKRYIHHYNFPPFSVGETGFMRGPKRREIGHGALAERALLPVVPGADEFAYALRLVSEVVSSNGSTSMASVCASTLSLMDAGVPIAAPVAGIAMGLISEDGKYTTLTDIQGAEDAFGDMDFKVAGTGEFVTALQLDTKLSGIPAQVLADALTQAKDARLEILDVITACIAEPRAEMNEHAPRAHVEYIPGDKIGEVIGPKGKIIREITEETGAQIDVEDEAGRGVVRIYAMTGAAADMALQRVRQIANPVVPQEGERYYGTVVKTVDFGAFVSLSPGSDGLLHISKLGGNKRLAHADEAVSVGEKLWVEVNEVKNGNKFSLVLIDPPADEDRGGAAADDTDDEPEVEVEVEVEETPAEPAPTPASSPEASEGGSGARRSRSREGRGGRSRSRSRGGDSDGGEGRTRRRRRG